MVSIDIQETLAARLDAQARSEGLSLQAYLERLAESGNIVERHHPTVTGEEFDRLVDSEANLSTNYGGTYSRADIYLDHD